MKERKTHTDETMAAAPLSSTLTRPALAPTRNIGDAQ